MDSGGEMKSARSDRRECSPQCGGYKERVNTGIPRSQAAQVGKVVFKNPHGQEMSNICGKKTVIV